MTRMTHRRLRAVGLLGGLAALPAAAQAHSFGRVLTLPVPLWLYVNGCAAALLLSFVVLGVLQAPARSRGIAGSPAPGPVPAARLRPRDGVGVALMALALVCALAGSLNPFRNFSMTWFWIVFLLGGLYVSAVAGTGVLPLNPWRALLLAVERAWPSPDKAPRGAGWAAAAAYVGLIALELFGHGSPRVLAAALLGYTAFTVACAARFGGHAWLRSGELFQTFLSVGGQLAPATRRPALSRDGATLFFVLFMLSSTAFDGLKETVLWNSLYWQRIAPAITPFLGGNLAKAYPQLNAIRSSIDFLVLALSPLVYLAACSLALMAARALMPPRVREATTVRDLLRALLPGLIPIAVAYNAAHYFTLLIGQGSRIFSLLLDPLGWGRSPMAGLPAPDPVTTWHVQLAIILAGHVAGMAWCHRDLWLPGCSRARNWLVQAPLLALMVLLTSSGLWILSLPVSPSRAL